MRSEWKNSRNLDGSQRQPEERPKQPEKKTFLTEMEERSGSQPGRKPDYSQHIYENIPVPASYQGRSLAEIYQAKMEIRRKQALFQQHMQPAPIPHNPSAGLYVTQALVHERPKHLISDAEATLKPQGAGRARSIRRHRKDSVSSDIRSIGGSESSCSACCSGCDECSSCSCSSCDSASTIRFRPDVEAQGGAQPAEPVALNFVQQRRMEIEKEQEIRLKDLIRRQDSTPGSRKNGQATDWAALAFRNKNIRSQQIYEPVSFPKSTALKKNSGSLAGRSKKLERLQSDGINGNTSSNNNSNNSSSNNNNNSRNRKESKAEGNKSQKRAEIVHKLKEQMRRNLEAEGDPEVRKRRHKELKQLLNVTLDAGSRTLSNISVGLIYVPMEEPEELRAAQHPDKEALHPEQSDAASNPTSGSLSGSMSLDENCEYDAFGSIDTLIFEPKTPTPEVSAGGGAPAGGAGPVEVSPEEVAKLQENINAQFDYLNDSEYNGSPSSASTSSSGSVTGSSETGSSDTGSSGSASSSTLGDSKNLKMAAAAVPATQVVPEPEAEEEVSSCAAAACCSVSACDESGSESGSFGSVIDLGRKLLNMAAEAAAAAADEIGADEAGADDTSPDDTGADDGRRRRAEEGFGVELTSAPVSCLNWTESGSEPYTLGDTDASWDYMDADGLSDGYSDNIRVSGDVLLVGNLRKRPVDSSGRYASALSPDADEAVRMLEALRMAEESNDSTSLQLLFPTLRREPEVSLGSTGPASGYQSLPQFPLKAEQPAGKVAAGIRKRDTMIRELKLKLRDKFRFISGSEPEASKKSLGALASSFVRIKNAEERIRSQPELDLDPVSYNVPVDGLSSTGYPHHLWPRISAIPQLELPESGSEPTTIYDPSLPEDIPQFPFNLGCHPHAAYPLDVLSFLPDSGIYYPEGLYGISAPLDGPLEETNRTRMRRKKKPRPHKEEHGDRKQVPSWRIDQPHPLPANDNEWLFWEERCLEQERQRRILLADSMGFFWDS